MNKVEANKNFPLWKVEVGEFVYGRDTGNPWSDPENDIRKSGNIQYFSKENVDADWILEYDERFGDFLYGFHQAAITLMKLQQTYDMKPKENTVMFEYQGIMFTFEHWINDQKCVCGTAIDDYYNEYDEDNRVKADIVQSIVFFYKKDCLVMKSGKYYLNGKMVATKQEMEEKHDIEYYQAEMMYPEEVRRKMSELFPEATEYQSWSASGYLKQSENVGVVALPKVDDSKGVAK